MNQTSYQRYGIQRNGMHLEIEAFILLASLIKKKGIEFVATMSTDTRYTYKREHNISLPRPHRVPYVMRCGRV